MMHAWLKEQFRDDQTSRETIAKVALTLALIDVVVVGLGMWLSS